MELPPTKVRQEYIDEVKVIEANIKDIASGTAPPELYKYSQEKLDSLAKHYQNNEQLGTARYKLYELQALLYYFQNRDDDALEFIKQAIEVKGASYKRAEQLIDQLKSAPVEPSSHNKHVTNGESDNELPLELQSLIKSLHTSAIIMVVISIISVYFIPWAVFYIILATKLKPDKLPSRKLIKGAAIATLPLCLGVIPIIIDVEFWRMNKHLIDYEEKGSKAFKTDKEFSAGDKKRKRSSKIAWIILLSLIAIFAIIIVVAIVSSNSNSSSTGTTNSLSNSKTPTPYTSVEHGFVINFPGFPQVERQTIKESGYNIPYTIYSADTDNGNKAYLVGVYDFTGIEINETGALEGAVNGAVQNTKGATLVSSSFSTFLGLKSIDAHYSAPIDGKNYDGYIKGFIKGGKMYAIFTIGETETAFDSFANTFSFN
jgi:hypothetical protein